MKTQSNTIPSDSLIAFQGVASVGSAQITSASGTQYLERGDFITHSFFSAGTYILDISDGIITLSNLSTGNSIAAVIEVRGRFNGLDVRKYRRSTGQGCEEILWRVTGAVKESIEISTDGYFHLMGDVNAPGPNMIYSTNSSGVKGWNPSPVLFGSSASYQVLSAPTNIPAGTPVIGNTLSLPAGKYLIFTYAKVVRQANGQIYVELKDGSSVIQNAAFEVDNVSSLNENFNLCTVYTSASSITLRVEYTGVAGVAQPNGLRDRTLIAIKVA